MHADDGEDQGVRVDEMVATTSLRRLIRGDVSLDFRTPQKILSRLPFEANGILVRCISGIQALVDLALGRGDLGRSNRYV